MYGAITKYRSDLGIGIITADDGRKFRFQSASVLNRREHLEGEDVYFDAASVKASEIIVLAGSPWIAFGGLA